jgi:hypothetical protein
VVALAGSAVAKAIAAVASATAMRVKDKRATMGLSGYRRSAPSG